MRKTALVSPGAPFASYCYAGASGASLAIFFACLSMGKAEGERTLWSRFATLALVNCLFCLSGAIENGIRDMSGLRSAIALNNAAGMLLAPAFLDFVYAYLRRSGRLVPLAVWVYSFFWAAAFLIFQDVLVLRDVAFASMAHHHFEYSWLYSVFLFGLFGIIGYALGILWLFGRMNRAWKAYMNAIYFSCVLWAFCGVYDTILAPLVRIAFPISWVGGVLVQIAFLRAVYARSQQAFRDQEKHRIMLQDLSAARQIQKNLITRQFPECAPVRISGMYKPMEAIGGDFYDVRKIDEGHISIFLSDVSGHGIASALITAMIKMSLDALPANLQRQPNEVLQYLNNALESRITGRFVTAIYGVLTLKSLEFHFSSAGHFPPALSRKAGGQEVIEHMIHGRVLGYFSELELETTTLRLEPGDSLLLSTDGICEERNPTGEMFGLSRLKRVFRSPDFRSLQDIFGEIESFRAGRAADDDMTALLVSVDPPDNAAHS